MPGSVSDSYEGPAGPLWDKAREAMDDFVTASQTPPCRVCKQTKDVIVYPDAHEQTICPECCDKAEHHDGEKGHQWEHDKWDGWCCRYCGIQRKCTEYEEDYIDRG